MEKISYERLLEIAEAMHTWIFLHCADEEMAYKEIGLTEAENKTLGYIGSIEVEYNPTANFAGEM